jgi:hypothetical protein
MRIFRDGHAHAKALGKLTDLKAAESGSVTGSRRAGIWDKTFGFAPWKTDAARARADKECLDLRPARCKIVKGC